MTIDRLWVFVSDERVGSLSSDSGRFTFAYEPGAREAISVRLPHREKPYEDAECRRFFANLLPEGAWRTAICSQLRIAPDHDFALLAAIGKDCAGAVALHPDPGWRPEHGVHRPTTAATIRTWVKNPAARPPVQSAPGLRLSLAGAQDKLLIHLEGTKPFLCEGGAPSTVILKPDISDAFGQIELSGLNELLSMRLAAKVGLATAEPFWFASAYAVRRFDRAHADSGWQRLHQEDFAQVLDLPPALKYEVRWKDCFETAASHATTPARARLELLDRLLFNLLLGNNDAHAKNFALLHDARGGIRLAPAYDLISTRIYPSLSPKLAVPIGPADSIESLDEQAWNAFAREAGLGLTFLRERGERLARSVAAAVESLLEETEEACPTVRDDIYPARRRRVLFQEITGVVLAHSKRLLDSLARRSSKRSRRIAQKKSRAGRRSR